MVDSRFCKKKKILTLSVCPLELMEFECVTEDGSWFSNLVNNFFLKIYFDTQAIHTLSLILIFLKIRFQILFWITLNNFLILVDIKIELMYSRYKRRWFQVLLTHDLFFFLQNKNLRKHFSFLLNSNYGIIMQYSC